MSKEHFYFSKSDRRACVALLVIIVLADFTRYQVRKHYNTLPVVQTDTMVWKQSKKSYPKKAITITAIMGRQIITNVAVQIKRYTRIQIAIHVMKGGNITVKTGMDITVMRDTSAHEMNLLTL